MPGFAGGRWTSTSARMTDRAPAGGGFSPLRGLSACGCSRAPGLAHVCASCRARGVAGLGAVSPGPRLKPQVLSVTNYVMSAGAFDPSRMKAELGGALTSLGYSIRPPKVTAVPLTWAWDYDAPSKVYQAKVVSGPFAAVTEGLGPTTTGAPTAADSQNLPSVGTVISFENIRLPVNADLGALRAALRSAKVTAARGSNAMTSGELLVKVTDKPSSPAGSLAALGLAALIGYALLEGRGEGA